MIFAKDLILKGVAGLAVVGGLGAGGIYVWNQRKEEDLNTLAGRVGLTCTPSDNLSTTTAGNCTKKTDSENIKVKKENGTTFNLSDISGGGSIKVYKLAASGDETTRYNKDFKFVIEGGDIGTSDKLEEFETYEVNQEGGEWKLIRKEKAVDVKKRLLGLPSEDTCKLPEDGTTSECQLDAAKLKDIKFEGKADGDVTIDNAGNGEQIKLKISKTSDAPFTDGGYKFVLETNKNISIPGTTSISIKKGTNTEFKIKITSSADNEGPRTLTLEKAWTAKSLGEKVGLNCPEGTDAAKECTLETAKVNVKNDDTKKYSGLSKKANGGEEKKVKFELDKEDHNQGFKFYVEGSDDICLQTNGASGSDSDAANKKIESKGSSEITYEIKEDSGIWYLTKKTAAGTPT